MARLRSINQSKQQQASNPVSEINQPTSKTNDPTRLSRPDSSSKPSIVRIVGTGDGIVMRIGDQDGRWSDIVRVLAGHLAKAEGFFQGERVAIEIGARLLTADDMQQLADVLAGYNIAIWAVRTSNPETRRMAQDIGLAVEGMDGSQSDQGSTSGKNERARWEVHLGQRNQATPSVKPHSEFQPPQAIADAIADRAIDQTDRKEAVPLGSPKPETTDRPPSDSPVGEGEVTDETDEAEAPEVILAPPYIFRGTLRSGQVFRHAGTIMLIGDVNPGAEVISGGDIFVWGRLRGIVHAGAMGNERAVVCAIDFEPIQLRIAGYIAMSPKAVSNEPGRWFWRRNAVEKPEVARVMGKQIVVDVWDRE